ncbi:hypothetical protein [Synechococcus sp. GFB01]|uniref:hypothetical protein n=1 Tax=Synechococcus sp. GFB01 TaxID=1662190 RepID=UPI000907F009|nr:hypothetical protein [Synechococcus sp. GFB01]
MREVIFQVCRDEPGLLEATTANSTVVITAASLEELRHEARDALIKQIGPGHIAFRVVVRRQRKPI